MGFLITVIVDGHHSLSKDYKVEDQLGSIELTIFLLTIESRIYFNLADLG